MLGVVASEFSRDMMLEGKPENAVKTRSSCRTTKVPVTISDPQATIYRATGIPADLGCDLRKRSFFVTNDTKGKAVRELLA